MIVSETYNGLFNNTYFLLVVGWGECMFITAVHADTHHVINTGPAVLIAALSAGIFHDDYGIYDDNQRKV